MNENQLISYISSEYQKGLTKNEVYADLLAKGWTSQYLDSIFHLFDDIGASQMTQKPENDTTNLAPDLNSSVTYPSQPIDITSNNTIILKEDPNTNAPTKLSNLKNSIKSKPFQKRILISIISILALIVVGVGGFFIYLNYFPAPEIVIARAFNNLSKTNSADFSIDGSVEFDDPSLKIFTNDGKFNVKTKGGFDNNDSKKAKVFFDAEFASDSKTFFSFKSLNLDKKSYLLINTLDLLPDSVKNQWVEFDDITKSDEPTIVENKKIIEELTANNSDPKKQNEINIQIAKTIKLTSLSDTKDNGQDLRHYKYTTDPKELVKLMKMINEKSDNANYENVELSGEVYIGKNDNNLYNFTVYYKDKGDSKFMINLDLKIKNHGKAIDISKPENSTKFEDFIKENDELCLFVGTCTSSLPSDDCIIGCDTPSTSLNSSDSDQFDDFDKDGLSSFLEKMYNTDPNKADTDGDGYSDGDEVSNGYNPNGNGKLEEKQSINLTKGGSIDY